MPVHHWTRNFQINRDDIEFLTSVLLEKERPLSTQTLARLLINERLAQETVALEERFKDSRFYNPAESYEVGQRVIFPALDYAAAAVVGTREGINPEHETFTVIKVEFEDSDTPDAIREFASNLSTPHVLSHANGEGLTEELNRSIPTPEEILAEFGDEITRKLENRLQETESLVRVAGLWFPQELLIEVNVGHLHLAEAILDINAGGPMTTNDILENIGGLGDGAPELQEFSLNFVLKDDGRFDEVGPTGDVLWYLTRLEPEEVQHPPQLLQYSPIEYDHSLLDNEMQELVREIDDELSSLTFSQAIDEATITLLYPHRRIGTLPLTARLRRLFPTAERAPRVYITLVDKQDGEEYSAWVVRQERFVYGLNKYYRKHRLPVGTFINISLSDDPGKILLDFNAYRPRTEWIRLLTPTNNQIAFKEDRRSIGADYDDLMILGADDLEAVDAMAKTAQQQRRPLASIISSVINALAPLSPQGTAHAKTIYSAVNVIRRCPPEPILATLAANPDFENVGGHYWRLSNS